jgi:hypothetical protein
MANEHPAATPEQIAERRRRAKRAAVLLGVVAVGVYVGFIILTFYRYH